MPVIFGTLTALVLAFSAWIAYKNDSEYKKQIALRQAEEANFKTEVDVLKSEIEQWKSAIVIKEDFQQKNTVLEEEVTVLESSITALKAEVAKKEADKSRLEAEIAEANGVMDKVGGARQLVPKIRTLRADIADLKQTIEDGNAKLSNLKQIKADTDLDINNNETRVSNETAGISQPTLKTTIKTVYSSWGFVTLNGGDIQGVVPGSILAVVRGGETVAKLKVSTVEENRAAADIDRESVGPDVYLRSGDKVVAYSATQPVKEEKPKGAGPVANKVSAN